MSRNVLWAALLLAGSAQADVFSVIWTYPDQPVVPITGFRIYCGLQPGGPYDGSPVAVAGTTDRMAQLTFEQSEKRYCVVAAGNETGESMPSNEITLVSKPNAPVDFRVDGMAPTGTPPEAMTPATAARPQGARAIPLPAPR